MFDPILVPLDGSMLAECVLPHTRAIAQAFNSKVKLLRVMERTLETEKTPLFDLVNWQINRTGAKLYLDKVSSKLENWGLDVDTITVEGLAAESIIDYAQNQNAKLIILSSHGRSGLSQWGISGIAQKVIFSAPTSVLIIRANISLREQPDEQHYTRIMVPLDGSRRAENVLPIVALFARTHQSQIHLVHVVGMPEMARQLPPTHEDMDLSEKMVSRNIDEAAHYLEQIKNQSPLDGIKIKTHLLTNANPAVALHEFAGQERVDLVALNAHGYSGNNQWPYGSMVNNFILYSKIPLLIVQDLPVREENMVSGVFPRHLTEK
jgi:nucleotide-binding universal stress UspA family protein